MAGIFRLGILFGYICVCLSSKKRLDFLELRVSRLEVSARSDILELGGLIDEINETVSAAGVGSSGPVNNPQIEIKLNALDAKLEQFMQEQREKSVALSKAITEEKTMTRKMLKIMKQLADSNAESVLEIEETLEQNEIERDKFRTDWKMFEEGMMSEFNELSEQTKLLNDKLENFDGNIVIHGSERQDACPKDWQREGDNCYLFEKDEKLSWYGARIRCDDFGGKLTEPDTAKEMTYIMTNVHADNVWIGATDDGHEGKWVWASSQQLVSSNLNWQSGQPNNLYENQHCMEIGLLAMNDESCLQDNYYICEKAVVQ